MRAAGGIEMRRLLRRGLAGTLLIALLLALPAWTAPSSAAERSMRFRPVPAESATTFDRTTLPTLGTIGDSAGARRHGIVSPAPIVIPPSGGNPDVEAPEPPDVP